MENLLIAYCGLDCEKCDARIATINNDNTLRKKTAKLWNELNHTDVIQPEWINCMGCRTEGCKTPFCSSMCEIRKCVKNKGYDTCADCLDKTKCPYLAKEIFNNEEARKRLGLE